MPSYTYNNDFSAVFGDLHAGVNALVDGKDLEEGSALVLEPGDVVTTDSPYEHPMLIESGKKAKAEKVEAPVDPKDSPAEAPADAPVEAPATDSTNK